MAALLCSRCSSFLTPFLPADPRPCPPSFSDSLIIHAKCHQIRTDFPSSATQSSSQQLPASILPSNSSFDPQQPDASTLRRPYIRIDVSNQQIPGVAAPSGSNEDTEQLSFSLKPVSRDASEVFEEKEADATGRQSKWKEAEGIPLNWRGSASEMDFQSKTEADDESLTSTESSIYEPALPASVSEEGWKRLPINLDLDLYRARCLFRNGQNSKAEAILRQCVKDWPYDGRAYVVLGTRLMKQGKFVVARAVFEDGCQAARGENPFIWQAWAILEEKVGHISQARKLFDAATAADMSHAAAWHGWAILELRQGSTRKARDLLSKGIKYSGGNEYLFQTSALLEYKAGKITEARELFNRAIQCNRKSCPSWLAWARVEADQGNKYAARYLFQKGLRASPKNRYAWQAWALFEAKEGNKEVARRLFQQGYELNPQDAVLLQAYALFEYESSNCDVARELFERASSVDPKHQPVWIAWGWIEWKEGNLDVARQYYKQSLSIESRSLDAARTFHAWGILEERAGNHSASRELFKCALKVDSQNVPAWMSLANLEESLGNAIRAEEIRNEYLRQRTEVVDETSWDMNLTSMFAPAIDRIKEFLRLEVETKNQQILGMESPLKVVEDLNECTFDMDMPLDHEDLDIEAFIREVLPWKYASQSKSSGVRSISFSTADSEAR